MIGGAGTGYPPSRSRTALLGDTMRTNLELRRSPIPMGAGLSTMRWIVLQDGRIKELFNDKEAALHYISRLKEDWSSKDE